MAWCPPSPPLLPTSSANYEWSLRQERAYLLSTLAAEESRCERYSQALKSTRSKLHIAERTDDKQEGDTKNLRKAASGLSRKLKSSQRSQRIVANNLAAVDARILSTEQHRWRRLQFEDQQAQNMPQVMMEMQNLTLNTSQPMYTQQIYQSPVAQTSLWAPPQGAPLTPQTTYLPSQDPWISPPYSPIDQQFPYPASQPMNPIQSHHAPFPIEVTSDVPAPWSPTSWSFIAGASTTNPFGPFPTPVTRHRAMSLPANLRTPSLSNKSNSQRSSSPLDNIGEEEEVKSSTESKPLDLNLNLGRKLSLIGGASAGLRLERIGTHEAAD